MNNQLRMLIDMQSKLIYKKFTMHSGKLPIEKKLKIDNGLICQQHFKFICYLRTQILWVTD